MNVKSFLKFSFFILINLGWSDIILDSLIKLDGYGQTINDIRKAYLHDFEKFENMLDSTVYAKMHKQLASEFDSIKMFDDYKLYFIEKSSKKERKQQWDNLNSKAWMELVKAPEGGFSEEEKNKFTQFLFESKNNPSEVKSRLAKLPTRKTYHLLMQNFLEVKKMLYTSINPQLFPPFQFSPEEIQEIFQKDSLSHYSYYFEIIPTTVEYRLKDNPDFEKIMFKVIESKENVKIEKNKFQFLKNYLEEKKMKFNRILSEAMK